MTKVYVLNYGVHTYEDGVFTVGVFSTPEKALEAVEPGRTDYYKNTRFGDYYYRIDEYTIDAD